MGGSIGTRFAISDCNSGGEGFRSSKEERGSGLKRLAANHGDRAPLFSARLQATQPKLQFAAAASLRWPAVQAAEVPASETATFCCPVAHVLFLFRKDERCVLRRPKLIFVKKK